MSYLIIGYGHLGKAIEAELEDRGCEVIVASNQGQAIQCLHDMRFEAVVDTAWRGSNNKVMRNSKPLQHDNYFQACARITAAPKGTRYIGIGSQAEVEPLQVGLADTCHTTMLFEHSLGVMNRTNVYGECKWRIAATLLAHHLLGLWVRIGTITHTEMPHDSVFRMAAVNNTMAVATDAAWCSMSLNSTAANIADLMTLGLQTGVMNLGFNHNLRDALRFVNPDIQFTDGPSRSVIMQGRMTLIEEDHLRRLGNVWRATMPVAEAQRK